MKSKVLVDSTKKLPKTSSKLEKNFSSIKAIKPLSRLEQIPSSCVKSQNLKDQSFATVPSAKKEVQNTLNNSSSDLKAYFQQLDLDKVNSLR